MSEYSSFQVDLNNQNSSWTRIYEMISPNSTVLDVGCSSGYFAEVLIENLKCAVDGLEIDTEDAKKARKICREVYELNLNNTSFSEIKQQYDFIIFADVLEHLLNPVEVLKRIKKLLKKDGAIIFSLPNMAHASVRLELLNGHFNYEDQGLLDKTHINFHTRESVDNMLAEAGYQIIKADRTYHDLPEGIIKKNLQNVGIEPTEKFIDLMNNGDAVTYQFVFAIKPGKTSKPVKKDYSNKALHHYRSQLSQLENDARRYMKDIEDLIASNKEKDREIERLKKNPLSRKMQSWRKK